MSGKNELTTALLSRKHPDYQEYLSHWNMYEDTYRGGRQWFKKHIHRYHKEGEDEFNTRVERAYRFNHPKEIVDLVGKYVFRAEISRSEDAPTEIKDFWARSSKRGWPVEELMPVFNKWASVFGRIWVVVDAKGFARDQTNAKEVKELGYAVHSHWVKPQDMLDCHYNEDDGELEWILLRETYRVQTDVLKINAGIRERYRLWTRNNWTLYEYIVDGSGQVTENLQQVSGDEHGLGFVPVIPLDNMTSNEDYTSSSLIADIAYLDKAVANYLSNLDAIIQDQTFSQLAMPAQAALFGDNDEDKKARSNMMEVGKKRVFLYDGETGQVPFFLSPDPKQAELIITAIKQIINEIYHSVGVAGERTKQDNSQGIDNSSGVAKAYDFDRVNSLLSNKGQTLQRFENKLCEYVMRWHGHDDFVVDKNDPLVTYPESYDVRSFNDELNISERFEAITVPLQLKQHQLKRAVKKLYPSMSNTGRKELEKAIDDMEEVTELLSSLTQNEAPNDASNSALPNEQNQDANSDDD